MDKRTLIKDIMDDCETMTKEYILNRIEKHKDILTMQDIIRIFNYYNQYTKSIRQ